MNADVCYRKAMTCLEAGQLDRAERLLRVAVLRAPDDVRAQLALRRVQQLKRQPPPEVTGHQPADPFTEARASLHEALRQRDYDRAADALTALRQDGTAGPEELLIQALLLHRIRQQPRLALSPLTQALRMDPDHPRALALMVELCDALGRTDQQRAAHERLQLLRRNPDRLASQLDRLIPPPRPRLRRLKVAARSRPAVWIALVCSMLFGGLSWAEQAPRGINVGPYQSVIGVTHAEIPPEGGEIVLRMPAQRWQELDEARQRAALSEMLQIARTQYSLGVLILVDESRSLLGSARPEDIHLCR